MRILYVCDKLITFILNEIIELEKMDNDVYILAARNDGWVLSHVIKPILINNDLSNKTFHRVRSYKNRKEKFLYLIGKLTYDFYMHPVMTIRACVNMLRIYSNLKIGTEDYLDVRRLFGLRFDVIHSPFSTPQIMDKVYFLSKLFNTPFTLSFRAHDIYQDNILGEIKERINIIQEASRIITISNYNRLYLKNILGIGRDIEVVHGSINVDFFRPKEERKSKRSIISVCRIDEQKGLIYLIKACQLLNERKINYECTIIGEGLEKRKLEKLINELQIPNINFINYLPQDEIREYLNRSAVFVLPCVIASDGTRDILANALKEAMAMQLPVITSNICGIEELVDDGINGILVPPEDPESIAEAIEKIFTHPDLIEKMGMEGRKTIEKDFNVKNEMKKLDSILRRTANRCGVHEPYGCHPSTAQD